MVEAGRQLGGPERGEAEVVEQVVAQLEVVELAGAHQQQQWFERQFGLAEAAAQGEGVVWVDVGRNDRAGPPLIGFVGHRPVGVADRLPRPAAQVEGLGQLGWRRVGVDEERIHADGRHQDGR